MRIEPCEYGDLPVSMVIAARRAGADLDQTLKSPWSIIRAVWGMDTVGFIGVLHRRTSATIRGWYVQAAFRGQGIGTRLLEAAIDTAYDQGAERVEIRTAQTRIAQRFGFEWTGYERKGGNRERHFVRLKPLT